MTLNDSAWELAFEEYGLLEAVNLEGQARVSAEQLKKFREPRLMAKIDHSKDLPAVFRENNLSILPTSNAGYAIGRFKIFQPIASSSSISSSSFPAPDHLETLSFADFSSEPAILHAAHASKILEDFFGDELFLTTSGRMRSGFFSFNVERFSGGPAHVEVRNAQIEIDAGYESSSALALIEAKNHSAVDFNVRQLYFPLRTWSERTNKLIRPTYLMANKGEFEVFEYQFEDLSSMSSLVLRQAKRYVFKQNLARENDLVDVARRGLGASPNHSTPFPQANSFKRVIDLVSVLIEQPQTAEALTTYYEFDKRQTKYYTDAAVYIGLADKRKSSTGKTVWIATPLAKGLFRLGTEARDVELAKLILSFDSFAQVFLEYVKSDRKPSTELIVEKLDQSADFEYYSGDTVPRRASTVRAWCEWILGLLS